MTIEEYNNHLECDDSCQVNKRDELLNNSMNLCINKVSNPQLDETKDY